MNTNTARSSTQPHCHFFFLRTSKQSRSQTEAVAIWERGRNTHAGSEKWREGAVRDLTGTLPSSPPKGDCIKLVSDKQLFSKKLKQ